MDINPSLKICADCNKTIENNDTYIACENCGIFTCGKCSPYLYIWLPNTCDICVLLTFIEKMDKTHLNELSVKQLKKYILYYDLIVHPTLTSSFPPSASLPPNFFPTPLNDKSMLIDAILSYRPLPEENTLFYKSFRVQEYSSLIHNEERKHLMAKSDKPECSSSASPYPLIAEPSTSSALSRSSSSSTTLPSLSIKTKSKEPMLSLISGTRSSTSQEKLDVYQQRQLQIVLEKLEQQSLNDNNNNNNNKATGSQRINVAESSSSSPSSNNINNNNNDGNIPSPAIQTLFDLRSKNKALISTVKRTNTSLSSSSPKNMTSNENDNKKEGKNKGKKSKVIYGVDKDVCKICLHKEQNSVFLDCGHLVCCFSCGTNWFKVNKQCIVCRQEIKKVIQVYKQ
ncbi:unnamed protein product [Cunninghamella blakesleeana]